MYLINCGSFRSDGGVMYGGIPRRVWQRIDQPDAQNRCVMAVNVAIIQIEDRIVLMDCGVGDVHERYLQGYGFEKNRALHKRLFDECGIHCSEVTDVIISHLHFDHCGGALMRDNAGHIAPTFPNARHWVSESQMQYATAPSTLDDDSYIAEDIHCLNTHTELSVISQPTSLCNGLRLHLFDGHTFGQIVTEFHIDQQAFLFVGDTIPTKNHFKKRWGSGYDLEPLKTLGSKLAIAKLATELNAGIIFPHEKEYPLWRCQQIGQDYTLIAYPAQNNPFRWKP